MGIIPTQEGRRGLMPDNGAGALATSAASGVNSIGEVVKRRKKGISLVALGALVVTGGLFRLIDVAVDETGTVVDQTKSNSEGHVPEVCVGDACIGEEATESTALPVATVAGQQPISNPSLGTVAPVVVEVQPTTVEVPAGAGGYALARLCLGLELDAPITDSVKAELAGIQALNGTVFAPQQVIACP